MNLELPKDIRLRPNGGTPEAAAPTDTTALTDTPTPVAGQPMPISPTSTPTNTPIPPTDTPTPPSVPPTNPLYPVTVQEWRDSVANPSTAMTREGDHYWRYVPGGTYTIGGWLNDPWNDNDARADVTLSDYHIGKYPVTVEQYRVFIEAGGYDNQSYWTNAGWQWRKEENKTSPRYWSGVNTSDQFNVNDEQPVVALSWYEATAFAAWLNEQLTDVLPDGTCIRLPTEAEWEAACAYDAAGQRHTYPWGDTPEPDASRAVFGDPDNGSPAPVGQRPDGAAACGAQDMVGNVWELTTNGSDRCYADNGDSVQGDFRIDESVSFRGGSWYTSNRTDVRCSSHGCFNVIKWSNDWGLRLFRSLCSP